MINIMVHSAFNLAEMDAKGTVTNLMEIVSVRTAPGRPLSAKVSGCCIPAGNRPLHSNLTLTKKKKKSTQSVDSRPPPPAPESEMGV